MIVHIMDPHAHRLWYDRQPASWNEALPIGGGSIAAMVFSRAERESLQLNEESLWEGNARDRVNPRARESLPRIRELLFAGVQAEAVALIERDLVSPDPHLDPYQGAGWLHLDWVHGGVRPGHGPWATNPASDEPWMRRVMAFDFVRELDLRQAVARMRCRYQGIEHQRESFASHVDRLVVVRCEAVAPGTAAAAAGDWDVHLQRADDVTARSAAIVDGRGLIELQAITHRGGMPIVLLAEVRCEGGTLAVHHGTIQVRGARVVEVRVAMATGWLAPGDLGGDPRRACQTHLAAASRKGFAQLRADHVADHGALYDRVGLHLGDAGAVGVDREPPTDARLRRMREGGEDPGLMALLFHYGRYLLIASSRADTLPANLQGKWADGANPPWDSDYHTNINLQMNYWLAGPANLAECEHALFRWMESLLPKGRDVARRLYGCEGAVFHHACDIHGAAEPVDGAPGVWPLGLAWLALHVWDHVRFTDDEAFLRQRGWTLLREAAVFLLDYLVEAPAGTACPGALVTAPSYSPENTFIDRHGVGGVFTYGATMDVMIAQELFSACESAGARLGIADPELMARLAEARRRLPPIQVSPSTGGIQEWIEDHAEAEPGHRHMSHLFGLHPGTTLRTSEHREAARRTIARRLAHGGGHTGWSKAWLVCFQARLGQGDDAHAQLVDFLAHRTLPNLFGDHPPFQIDGNFGVTAGIAELLVQSHDEGLHLLPALPSGWRTGTVRGLRARGGITIDLAWIDGRLASATLTSDRSVSVRVRIADGAAQTIELPAGVKRVMDPR